MGHTRRSPRLAVRAASSQRGSQGRRGAAQRDGPGTARTLVFGGAARPPGTGATAEVLLRGDPLNGTDGAAADDGLPMRGRRADGEPTAIEGLPKRSCACPCAKHGETDGDPDYGVEWTLPPRQRWDNKEIPGPGVLEWVNEAGGLLPVQPPRHGEAIHRDVYLLAQIAAHNSFLGSMYTREILAGQRRMSGRFKRFREAVIDAMRYMKRSRSADGVVDVEGAREVLHASDRSPVVLGSTEVPGGERPAVSAGCATSLPEGTPSARPPPSGGRSPRGTGSQPVQPVEGAATSAGAVPAEAAPPAGVPAVRGAADPRAAAAVDGAAAHVAAAAVPPGATGGGSRPDPARIARALFSDRLGQRVRQVRVALTTALCHRVVRPRTAGDVQPFQGEARKAYKLVVVECLTMRSDVADHVLKMVFTPIARTLSSSRPLTLSAWMGKHKSNVHAALSKRIHAAWHVGADFDGSVEQAKAALNGRAYFLDPASLPGVLRAVLAVVQYCIKDDETYLVAEGGEVILKTHLSTLAFVLGKVRFGLHLVVLFPSY